MEFEKENKNSNLKISCKTGKLCVFFFKDKNKNPFSPQLRKEKKNSWALGRFSFDLNTLFTQSQPTCSLVVFKS